MLKFSDILVVILLSLAFFISGIAILTSDWFTDNIPYSIPTIFLLFFIYFFISLVVKGHKKIATFAQPLFEKKGLKIIAERPLTISELVFKEKVTGKVEPIINGIPLSRFGYIRKFVRIFTVEDNDNNTSEIRTEMTLNWDGKVKIDI